MSWQEALKGAAEAAKGAADKLSAVFLAEIWPTLEPQVLKLAAKIPDDVRSGALQANDKVRAFLKDKAKPSVVDMLRNDDTFLFLSEMIYDTLPRSTRKRVRQERVVEFFQKQRGRLLGLLEAKQAATPADPPSAPPAQ